jgi:hypothetical protein
MEHGIFGVISFPPFPQKEAERMGHGVFWCSSIPGGGGYSSSPIVVEENRDR